MLVNAVLFAQRRLRAGDPAHRLAKDEGNYDPMPVNAVLFGHMDAVSRYSSSPP